MELVRIDRVYIYAMKRDEGHKVPWNLSINAEIKRLMQIRCAEEGRDISELTEELYLKFLKEYEKKLSIAD